MARLSPRKIHDLDNIAECVKRRQLADEAIAECVIAARENGRSWREIAARLGISHQGAQQKYGRLGVQVLPDGSVSAD